MAIKAVAFDIDGTLYHNSVMYLRSFPWALRHLRLFDAFRRARVELRTIRPIENFHDLQAQIVARMLGMDVAAAKIAIEHKIYREWAAVFKDIPLVKNIEDCLKSLKSMGLKLAVLSDFPIEPKLKDIRLESWWDYALSTEDIGYLKPAREGFDALSKGLNVPHQEIVYVGNSYRYDVIGASIVGMKTAHFTKKHRADSVADISFSVYANLLAWVVKNS